MLCSGHALTKGSLQKQESGSFGFLINVQKQVVAFQLDDDGTPVQAPVWIQKTGAYKQGFILSDALMESDPVKKLDDTMRRLTLKPAPKAGVKNEMHITETVPEPECPDVPPAEQSIWYIKLLLGRRAGMARVTAVSM